MCWNSCPVLCSSQAAQSCVCGRFCTFYVYVVEPFCGVSTDGTDDELIALVCSIDNYLRNRYLNHGWSSLKF